MNILEQLAQHATERVANAKKVISEQDMMRMALDLPKGNFEFETALKKPDISFICECKKASPSKGVIAEDFPYLKIAKEYEMAGADCISVLTEPKWFLGKDTYLSEIANTVSIPCIRKDFTVDPYMIYEAKVLDAKAVLLICSILETKQLQEYLSICDTLGISALVEAHDAAEIEKALSIGARVIGVNNRNLKDFTVNTSNSIHLKPLVPKEVVFVSESGVKTHEDIALLREQGVDAVLIGEALMKAVNKKEKMLELKGR